MILVPIFYERNIRTEEAVMGKSAATIVLVHGAWADGSSWNKVISLLQTKDLPVIAGQIPLTSLEDDLAATSRMASGCSMRVSVGSLGSGLAAFT